MNVQADVECSPGGVDLLHVSKCLPKLDILRRLLKMTDVWFIVGDKRLGAHKIILSAVSPVFLAMFESGMKEMFENEIVLTDTDPNDFDEFLKFVYSAERPNFKHHVVGLLALAHKYDVSRLLDLCNEYLSDTLNETNVCEILSLASLFSLDPLKEKALSFIRDSNIEVVVDTEGWREIISNAHLGSLIVRLFANPSVESKHENFSQVSRKLNVLCQAEVKSIEWTLNWSAVLNHCVTEHLHSHSFSLQLHDKQTPLFFRLLCTKGENKRQGIVILFWIEIATDEIPAVVLGSSGSIQLDCLTVLHSALSGGEYRQPSTFKWDSEKDTRRRKILSFFMHQNHYSVDNSIRLSLNFLQPGQCRILNESPGQGLNLVPTVMRRTHEFADVIIKVEEGVFPAHKLILASQSDFFNKLFKNTPRTEYILEDVDLESFEIVLNFMYCKRFPELKGICITLIKTAALLGLEELLRFCSPVVAENITVDHAVDLFLIAQAPGAETLKKSALKFIGSNLESVISSAGWRKLFVHTNPIVDSACSVEVLKESAREFIGSILEDVLICSTGWPELLTNSSPNPFTELVIALYHQKTVEPPKKIEEVDQIIV